MPTCPTAHLPVYLYACPPAYLPTCRPTCLTAYLPLPKCLQFCRPAVHLTVHLSNLLPTYLLACQVPSCPPACPSTCLPLCLPVNMMTIYQLICLSYISYDMVRQLGSESPMLLLFSRLCLKMSSFLHVCTCIRPRRFLPSRSV